jgi:MarR family 2-MHQ and catechol resistance regulon transcriptional repressor
LKRGAIDALPLFVQAGRKDAIEALRVGKKTGSNKAASGAAGNHLSPALALHIQFLKLATLVSRPMRELVAQPNALTIDDIKIMLCLGDRGALTGREISELVALNTMAASRAIAHLDEMGWLVREEDVRDKRRRPVALSKKGLEGYRSIMPSIGKVADAIFGGFSELELVALFDALARVESRLAEIAALSPPADDRDCQ